MQDYIRERHLENELWDAIEEQDIDRISKVIESGCDLNGNNGASFEEGDTFLMAAALIGNLEIVKLLVESGADVNAISTCGDSALLNAVLNDYQEIANYLRPLTNEKNKAVVDRYINTGQFYPPKSKKKNS